MSKLPCLRWFAVVALGGCRDQKARVRRWQAIKGAQHSSVMKPCSIWTAARAIRDFEIINGVTHDGDGHRIYTDGMGGFRQTFERQARVTGKPHKLRG
jgi:hypothetical protein